MLGEIGGRFQSRGLIIYGWSLFVTVCEVFEGGSSLAGENPVCWCVIVIKTTILILNLNNLYHIFLILGLNS